jgi:hypothetical protein
MLISAFWTGGVLIAAKVHGEPSAVPAIYQLSDLDQTPKAKIQVRPAFPAFSTREQIRASVDVAFVVDKDGRVFGIRARKCTVSTSTKSIDFSATAHATDSKTHKSAEKDPEYAALLDAANKFAASAVQGVSKWKFWPGKKGGVPVNAVMAVEIAYRHDLSFHDGFESEPAYRISSFTDSNSHSQSVYNTFVSPTISEKYVVYFPKL